jgi:CBS domain-containing protein
MKVEQVMTREVVTVTPETPLKEVAAILAERRISGLPVCDETSRVVGVVSENDILFKELGPDQRRGGPLAWLLDPAPSRSPKTIARTAAEAMTSPAVMTRPKAQVSEAARVMVERGVNRLPVVKDGQLVGIVTRADLVKAFVRSDEEIAGEIREDVIRKTLWLVPEELKVEVDNGDVKIAGRVDTRTDADLIKAFVSKVPGVISVTAEIEWVFDDLARRRGEDRIAKRI